MNITEIISKPYGAAEAEAADTRSRDNQRYDRKKGYSPSIPGHTRYDAVGLCRLFCIEQFARKGIGPAESVKFADEVAGEMAYFLVRHPRAWPKAALDAVDMRGEERRYVPWFGAAAQLASRLDDPRIVESKATRGIVVFVDGSFEISDNPMGSIDEAYMWDEKLGGVLNIMLFAVSVYTQLAPKLPRPLFEVRGL